MNEVRLYLVSQHQRRGFNDYDVSHCLPILRICVPFSVQIGDTVNCYMDEGRKEGITWTGDVIGTLSKFVGRELTLSPVPAGMPECYGRDVDGKTAVMYRGIGLPSTSQADFELAHQQSLDGHNVRHGQQVRVVETGAIGVVTDTAVIEPDTLDGFFIRVAFTPSGEVLGQTGTFYPHQLEVIG